MSGYVRLPTWIYVAILLLWGVSGYMLGHSVGSAHAWEACREAIRATVERIP